MTSPELIPLKSRITGLMTIRDHTFLYRTLNSSSIVVDLGAYKGEFSNRIHDLFGCQCIAVEANPDLAEKLREKDSFKFHHFAIASKRGPIQFHVANNLLASSTRDLAPSPFEHTATVEVPGIKFEEFLKECGIDRIDLLKVDIEGAELDLFNTTSDETLLAISQIAVEFHDFCSFITPGDTERISRRLMRLGFYPVPFMGNENTLFINQRKLKLSAIRMFLLRYILSPIRTAKRVLDRGRLRVLFFFRDRRRLHS